MADLPSGTISFLFTDLEGSTRLWQEHPDAMREALARHDQILRDVMEAHHGHVVKTTGDGALAVFATASDAVEAAIAAQRRIGEESWTVPEPLRVRIGINTGPAELRDGDYHGTAVNRAARIMSLAHGGQTLLSLATRELVRDTGVDLRDVGEHVLRGIAGAERVFQLSVPGLPSEFPPLSSSGVLLEPVRIPAPAIGRPEPFVGRRAALEQLQTSWEQARDGIRQLVLVGGEPGVGKTRLASELCARADAADVGAAVLYGRCDEETVVPYQPFIEALRPCVAALAPATLEDRLHDLGRDLVRVFPELRYRLPDPPPPADTGTGGTTGLDESRVVDRYRLFEAITTLVRTITATQPVLIVLDDLQWADPPTVLLFRHVLRGVTRAPLLVVGCYRDVELPRGHTVADLLADLRREPSVSWIPLRGLSATETEDLLTSRAGQPLDARLVEVLHHETDGNPFFLEELLRHLRETEATALLERGNDALEVDELELPDTIRDVVGRRLRRLPSAVSDALDVAAVIGAEFDAPLLARATGQPPDETLDALGQATTAGLVSEVAKQPGRYTFAHGLIRQAVYADLVSARRAQLHHRVGVALESDRTARRPAAMLAHHFLNAVALGDVEPAIRYATAAGHEAAADFAFEDAARYFGQALELLERDPLADPSVRAELLIDHADALVYVDEATGVEAAWRAVEASRLAGSPQQFGRAVAVFVEPALTAAARPQDVSDLFDEALAALGDEAPALRARLLALLAFKYTTSQLRGRDGRSLADEALKAARATDDPMTLADALLARAVSVEGVADLTERTALGDELLALGRTAGARPASYGLSVLAGVQLANGDANALAASIVQLSRLGTERRWLPAHVYATRWQATQAMLEGRFDDARAAAKEMRRYVSAYRGAAGIRGALLFHVAREQGDLGALPMDLALADQRDNLHAMVMMALAQVDNGQLHATLAELAVIAAEGTTAEGTTPAGEPGWPSLLAVLTEAAATAGDGTHAEFLAARLIPFAGHLLALPTGLATLGAADRYLGMLATLLERWDEGADHFAQALALETRARGFALLPRTRYWYARFLRARGRAGDDAAARAALQTVDDDAVRLEMRRLHTQASEIIST